MVLHLWVGGGGVKHKVLFRAEWYLCSGGGGGSGVDGGGAGGGVDGSGLSSDVDDSGKSTERIVYRSSGVGWSIVYRSGGGILYRRN